MPPEPVEPLAPANAKNKTLLQCSSFIASAPACHALQPGRAEKRRWFAITGHTERIGCLRGPGMSAAAQPENVTRRVRFSFFFGSRKPLGGSQPGPRAGSRETRARSVPSRTNLDPSSLILNLPPIRLLSRAGHLRAWFGLASPVGMCTTVASLKSCCFLREESTAL
jgi:hypothetical protein